jgi:4-hydroxy-3-methylbut-2-enyl diphosphate reductase
LPSEVFRKGLNLKHVVADELARDYHSDLVETIRGNDFIYRDGRASIHLAEEFGFCYGVDRAVDYAYQTRKKFPDRTVYLTGEIIHNPHVNARLRSAGIRFLSDPTESSDQVASDDVVILPAFGVTIGELERLTNSGCTLVDTTCGSVLNVWKNVRQYARDGYTAVIHGKVKHEETQATASQARITDNGRYVIVLDRKEAELLCDYITGKQPLDTFQSHFLNACSPNFDPNKDLIRVGLANQTTMLMSESLEIGQLIRRAMVTRYGESNINEHYQAFDTICSATQDRQDAIQTLLDTANLDLAIVIGGYNSSNTRNLAKICAPKVPTYHIAEPSCLVSTSELRHLPTTTPAGTSVEQTEHHWLPNTGKLSIGVSAGASTPDNIVGKVISRLADLAKTEHR